MRRETTGMVLSTLENLENLEKSGNFVVVRENLENLEKSGNFVKISQKNIFSSLIIFFHNSQTSSMCALNTLHISNFIIHLVSVSLAW